MKNELVDKYINDKFEEPLCLSMKRDYSFEKRMVELSSAEMYLASEAGRYFAHQFFIDPISPDNFKTYVKNILNNPICFDNYPVSFPFLSLVHNFNTTRNLSFKDTVKVCLETWFGYCENYFDMIVEEYKKANTAQKIQAGDYVATLLVNENKKSAIYRMCRDKIQRTISYPLDALENPIYGLLNVDCSDIVIITDAVDLAIHNNQLLKNDKLFGNKVAWVAPWRMDLLEKCDFTALKGKETFYYFGGHSKLKQEELISNFNRIYASVSRSNGYLNVIIENSSKKVGLTIHKRFNLISRSEFTFLLNSLNKPLLKLGQRSLNKQQVIMTPFLYSGSITAVYGSLQRSSQLLGVMTAYAVSKGSTCLSNWEAKIETNVACLVFNSLSIEEDEKFVRSIFSRQPGFSSPKLDVFNYGISFSEFNLHRLHGRFDEYGLLMIFMDRTLSGEEQEYLELMRKLGHAIVVVFCGITRLKNHSRFDNVIRLTDKNNSAPEKSRFMLQFEKVLRSYPNMKKKFMLEVDRIEGRENLKKVGKPRADWSQGVRKKSREELAKRVSEMSTETIQGSNGEGVYRWKLKEIAKELKISESMVKKLRRELNIEKRYKAKGREVDIVAIAKENGGF